MTEVSDKRPGSPEDETPESIATLFTARQAVTIHSQENKSFALYNFLLFNSFLLMGWATLFSQERTPADVITLTFFCALGILVALVWRGLLRDYSKSSDLFRSYLVQAERYLPPRWQGPHAGRDELIHERDKVSSQHGLGKGAGSRDLLGVLPIAFVAIYVVLAAMTWLKCLEGICQKYTW